MKTKLFTKNRVLGLLIAFVLAFGVQGTVEAITKFTRGSGDLKLYAPNEDFKINFSVSLQSRIVNETGPPVTYHYDDESINIEVSGANITKIGSRDITAASSHNMNEKGTNAARLSSSVSVTLRASAAGPVTITITDTSDANRPSEAVDALPLVFTVYIANRDNYTNTITAVSAPLFTTGEVQINSGNSVAFSGELTNVRVNYRVSGSGSVYVKTTNNKGSGSKNLTTSSVAPVFLNMGGSTNKVTVSILPTGRIGSYSTTATYIYSHAVLTKHSGDKQKGARSSRLSDPIVVKVVDGKNRAVSGVQVDFTATGGGSFPKDPSVPSSRYVSTENGSMIKTDASGLVPALWVLGSEADSAQTATATLNGTSDAPGRANTVMFTATFGTTTSTASSIAIESGNGQRADEFNTIEDPLVVIVRDQRGQLLNGANVEFLARDGGIISVASADPGTESTADGYTGTAIRRVVVTDNSGQASVRYSPPEGGARRTVRAGILNTAKSVVFTVNGAPGSGGGGGGGEDDDGGESPPVARVITFSPTSISGGPGTDHTLTVSAGTGTARLVGAAGLISAGGSVTRGTGNNWSVTLPDSAGSSYTITFGASGYDDSDISVSVTEPPAPGTLTLTPLGTRSGAQQNFRVTAQRGGSPPSSALTVTLTGVTNRTTVTIQAGQSFTAFAATLASASAAQIVTADAEGYNRTTITIPAPGQQPPTGQQQPSPQQTAGGTPDEVRPRGEVFRSGTANTQLAQPLVVRVLDANDRAVRNARVTFQVTSGRGRLSQRGNGQAAQARTNASGDASAPYTPISAESTVRARAAGVSRTVTFTITTSAAATATSDTAGPRRYEVRDEIPLSLNGILRFSGERIQDGTVYTCVGSRECVVSYGTLVRGEIQAAPVAKDEVKTYKVRDEIPLSPNGVLRFTGQHTQNGKVYTCVGSGECVVSYGILTKGDIEVSTASVRSTGGTPISPEVHLAAASRPPMLWVDGGSLYALVGKSVEKFAPSVSNAQHITVAGDKVYWTEKTGDSAGTINRANLDGTGVTELAEIMAVPMGIAVDTASRKLYVTNSRGKLLSMNLDGSHIQTVLRDLPNPKDLAVSGGTAYWTQDGGAVRFVNLSGTSKNVRSLSSGADAEAGSLVISGMKVYWTERTGESGGTVNSANLNSTGVTRVASIARTPIGIAVDAARGKLYVTNSGGKILWMNLDGSYIRMVVDGLGMPGDLVISNSIKAPVTATPTSTSTTALKSKYDVNGDGKVDNVDASLVAGAMNTSNATYDVNSDGTVNFLDLLLIFDNRDEGAASAPTIVGMKLSVVQVDTLKEQIDLLIATGDRSPTAIKTLIYLQQLIALARPEKTQLLANYPNPFNPETWIPYELATGTEVKITIYNAQGVVIRSLHLGQQTAGYYTDRERAAYWDGRNALGEQVASGIYFYQLETDEMSSLRKMVILK